MIGVYILHVQSACRAEDAIIFSAIAPFYVNGFFVISGYLFFRKWLAPSRLIPGRKEYANLLFRLVIPTIIFSSVLYIPKHMFHSRDLYVGQFLYDVFGGVSYWFTSAMAVAQCVLLVAVAIGLKKMRGFVVLSLIMTLLLPVCKEYSTTPFPWYWKSGLIGVMLMTFGGIVFECRGFIKRYVDTLLALSCLGYSVVVYSIITRGGIYFMAMSANFNISGVVATLTGVSFISLLSYRVIPSLKFLQFIGKNSVVFYFLSGVIPASLSIIPISTDMGGGLTVLAFSTVAVLIGVFCTWGITHYLPFLTDLRTLKR